MLRFIGAFMFFALVAIAALITPATSNAETQSNSVTASTADESVVQRPAMIARSRRVIGPAEPTTVEAAKPDASALDATKQTTATVAPAPAAALPQPVATPQPVAVPSVADARDYAFGQVGAGQFGCLDALWQHESGWNPAARNPWSGAYGIPQALPGAKMASIGGDWSYNPVTQVRWGLGYIRASYGTPCGAWSFWLAHHWY